jgi:hypothetical protein
MNPYHAISRIRGIAIDIVAKMQQQQLITFVWGANRYIQTRLNMHQLSCCMAIVKGLVTLDYYTYKSSRNR